MKKSGKLVKTAYSTSRLRARAPLQSKSTPYHKEVLLHSGMMAGTAGTACEVMIIQNKHWSRVSRQYVQKSLKGDLRYECTL